VAIEWYPGHMVTARKDAAEAMRTTDVVIEVLDARVPFSSCNPLVERLRLKLDRPALKVINKADIADPKLTDAWLAYYNAIPGTRAIAISAKKAGDVQRIPKECLQLSPTRNTALKPLRMMILGIPNAGKSTLMNTLLKRNISKVGDEPAITKMHHKHELSKSMWLTDTPGMLWPGVAQPSALRLAIANAIGRNAYDEEEVARGLVEILSERYPTLLEKRYGKLEGDLIEAIARRRSFVIKGGAFDLQKAGLALLTDFRSGVLGRITLDDPKTAIPTPLDE
jgi:ribosome biogenesis GTPase A